MLYKFGSLVHVGKARENSRRAACGYRKERKGKTNAANGMMLVYSKLSADTPLSSEKKGKANAANGMMLVYILSFQRIRRSLQRKRAPYPLKA